MDFEEHCYRTKEVFGFRGEDVHRWLDEFVKNYSIGERYKHRKFRHHMEGLIEARGIFGRAGGLVAVLHVMDDNEGEIPLRKDYYGDLYLKEMYLD